MPYDPVLQVDELYPERSFISNFFHTQRIQTSSILQALANFQSCIRDDDNHTRHKHSCHLHFMKSVFCNILLLFEAAERHDDKAAGRKRASRDDLQTMDGKAEMLGKVSHK